MPVGIEARAARNVAVTAAGGHPHKAESLLWLGVHAFLRLAFLKGETTYRNAYYSGVRAPSLVGVRGLNARPFAGELRRLGMSTSMKTYQRIIGFLALVLTLLLGACRTDITFEVHPDGKIKTVVIAEDSRGTLAAIHQTCDDLRVQFKRVGNLSENAKMEDITPSGGNLTCRYTSDDPIRKGEKITDNGRNYSLTFPPSTQQSQTNRKMNATTTIVMPGKIVRTTVGRIEGNKVIIKGLDYISDGFTIVAQKESSSNHSDSSSSKKPGVSVSEKADGGFSVWGWALVGAGVCVVVVIVVGVVVAVTKRRRGRGQAVGPYSYQGR